MSIRGFGVTTASGSAQPAFGTTLTAATAQPSPDIFTGNVAPASRPSSLVLAVANPSIFLKGDKVAVGLAANFSPLTLTQQPDYGQVIAVNVGGSTITVSGLTRAHASGEFVVISVQAARIRIIYFGSSNLYIGGDATVGATSPTLADDLTATGQAYDLGQSTLGNAYGTAGFWVKGTAADTFLPSIVTV